VLDTRLIPDPRKAKLRVGHELDAQVDVLYARAMVLGATRTITATSRRSEAVFTHASTSPNQ
jgi:hypothetical protein